MANSRVRLSYRFLVDREEKQEAFTVDELALQTGWKRRVLKPTSRKNWSGFSSMTANSLR
ncbi:MAG: hypothetical protein ACOX4K_05785 [Bacillota bacterium]